MKEFPLMRQKKLFSLLNKELNAENSLVKSVKPNFFERLNSLLALSRPVVIAISGESASGKTTFLKLLREQTSRLQERRENLIMSSIKGDNYFNDISLLIKKYGGFDELLATGYNPDSPRCFQLDLMRKDLTELMLKKSVYIPRYEVNGTGVSVPNAILINPAEVIVVEGMCSLYDDIHDIFDMKIFIDVDEKTQKERYFARCEKRNQAVEDAKKQLEIVTESAKKYLRPTKKYADLVIDGSADIDRIRIFLRDFFNSVVSGSKTTTSNPNLIFKN